MMRDCTPLRDAKSFLLQQLSDANVRDLVVKMIKNKCPKAKSVSQSAGSTDPSSASVTSNARLKSSMKLNFPSSQVKDGLYTKESKKQVTPAVSPDRKPTRLAELKKLRQKYTFVGKQPQNNPTYSYTNNCYNYESKYGYTNNNKISHKQGDSKVDIQRNGKTRPKKQVEERLSDQSRNSSKDSGISGSTKTDIDLTPRYSNDEDVLSEWSASGEVKSINSEKQHKTVRFDVITKVSPQRINVLNGDKRLEKTKTAGKYSNKDKTKKKKRYQFRSPSPTADGNLSPGMTEVAKWVPSSVDDHHKPYYEAWVNTRFAAVSRHTEEEKALLERQNRILNIQNTESRTYRPKSPEFIYINMLDEQYAGRITVRRSRKDTSGAYEIHSRL